MGEGINENALAAWPGRSRLRLLLHAGAHRLAALGLEVQGGAAAQVVEGIFDELLVAPDAGYLQDNKNTPAYAIPTGSGNGWYSYNGATQVISPIAGRVIVVKTTEGKYAKLEILSYYQNAPAEPNAMSDMPRYYTFRYIYQPDGTKNFK